tara:strand:+ start:55 stop:654 length:600 start_codon:yes stop_codon:yes gene_type:complete
MYTTLRNHDYKKYVETKGNDKFSADYISWAVMHDKLKKNFKYVEYIVHEYNGLPYMALPDGSAIVKITLAFQTVDGDEHKHSECLAVRDFRMQAAKNPDSAQIENTIRRCIAKAGSMATGFGIELWFNEDIRDLDYQQPPPTPMTDDQKSTISVLIQNPALIDSNTDQLVKWIGKKQTEKDANSVIKKLQDKIKEQGDL